MYKNQRSVGRPNFRNSRPRSQYKVKDQSREISYFIQSSKNGLIEPVLTETITKTTFHDFSLDAKLKANLDYLGFSKPTPIQEATIKHVQNGKNVLGIANTGTGKTGAFLIPLINNLIKNNNQKILIVAPTRELALQIQKVFKDLAYGLNIFSAICIGGSDMRKQVQQLKNHNHVFIGTPGRILDLIERKKLSLFNCQTVVLDEVDRMLDMGFVHDIKKIIDHTPEKKQGLYFSATINPRVSDLITCFSGSVERVSLSQTDITTSVDQEIIRYQNEDQKFIILEKILKSEEVTKSVIFSRTKHGVKKLMFRLQDLGLKADSLHGNKTQQQRQKALLSFRKSKINILVATDVASRGIDVDDISHVINYDLPESLDDYIHRVGRTGRAGKKGQALTFMR